MENSYYGFHSQSGRPGNAETAFGTALAKPNQKCSVAFCIITILFILPILSFFFIISRVDKASAADKEDWGSITGLLKPKLEKNLYSHPAYRLDISNKMGSAKLHRVW